MAKTTNTGSTNFIVTIDRAADGVNILLPDPRSAGNLQMPRVYDIQNRGFSKNFLQHRSGVNDGFFSAGVEFLVVVGDKVYKQPCYIAEGKKTEVFKTADDQTFATPPLAFKQISNSFRFFVNANSDVLHVGYRKFVGTPSVSCHDDTLVGEVCYTEVGFLSVDMRTESVTQTMLTENMINELHLIDAIANLPDLIGFIKDAGYTLNHYRRIGSLFPILTHGMKDLIGANQATRNIMVGHVYPKSEMKKDYLHYCNGVRPGEKFYKKFYPNIVREHTMHVLSVLAARSQPTWLFRPFYEGKDMLPATEYNAGFIIKKPTHNTMTYYPENALFPQVVPKIVDSRGDLFKHHHGQIRENSYPTTLVNRNHAYGVEENNYFPVEATLNDYPILRSLTEQYHHAYPFRCFDRVEAVRHAVHQERKFKLFTRYTNNILIHLKRGENDCSFSHGEHLYGSDLSLFDRHTDQRVFYPAYEEDPREGSLLAKAVIPIVPFNDVAAGGGYPGPFQRKERSHRSLDIVIDAPIFIDSIVDYYPAGSNNTIPASLASIFYIRADNCTVNITINEPIVLSLEDQLTYEDRARFSVVNYDRATTHWEGRSARFNRFSRANCPRLASLFTVDGENVAVNVLVNAPVIFIHNNKKVNLHARHQVFSLLHCLGSQRKCAFNVLGHHRIGEIDELHNHGTNRDFVQTWYNAKNKEALLKQLFLDNQLESYSRRMFKIVSAFMPIAADGTYEAVELLDYDGFDFFTAKALPLDIVSIDNHHDGRLAVDRYFGSYINVDTNWLDPAQPSWPFSSHHAFPSYFGWYDNARSGPFEFDHAASYVLNGNIAKYTYGNFNSGFFDFAPAGVIGANNGHGFKFDYASAMPPVEFDLLYDHTVEKQETFCQSSFAKLTAEIKKQTGCSESQIKQMRNYGWQYVKEAHAVDRTIYLSDNMKDTTIFNYKNLDKRALAIVEDKLK